MAGETPNMNIPVVVIENGGLFGIVRKECIGKFQNQLDTFLEHVLEWISNTFLSGFPIHFEDGSGFLKTWRPRGFACLSGLYLLETTSPSKR